MPVLNVKEINVQNRFYLNNQILSDTIISLAFAQPGGFIGRNCNVTARG